jgi:hypothetical protein
MKQQNAAAAAAANRQGLLYVDDECIHAQAAAAAAAAQARAHAHGKAVTFVFHRVGALQNHCKNATLRVVTAQNALTS